MPEPNPKRVAAGRLNRAKRGPLSESGRQRLSDAARRTRPWEHARGPKSVEGKVIVARNLPAKKENQAPAPTFEDACQRVLEQLKRFRKIEMTPSGPQFVVGLSETFFAQADLFVRKQAEQRAEAERQYLESLKSDPTLQEPLVDRST